VKRGDSGATTLYLHVFDWPADRKLRVPGLWSEVSSAKLLATGAEVSTSADGETLVIDLPAGPTDPVDTVIALRIDGLLTVVP
jgi:alpha-L-fucosidase